MLSFYLLISIKKRNHENVSVIVFSTFFKNKIWSEKNKMSLTSNPYLACTEKLSRVNIIRDHCCVLKVDRVTDKRRYTVHIQPLVNGEFLLFIGNKMHHCSREYTHRFFWVLPYLVFCD